MLQDILLIFRELPTCCRQTSQPYPILSSAAFSILRTSAMTSLTAFFSGRDWYVWGAGLYGSRLKEFLDTMGVRICGFIDSSPDKQGMNVGGIKIYGWKDVACEARNVCIAIKDRAATEQIKALVHDTAPSVSVYGFADLTDYAVRRMA